MTTQKIPTTTLRPDVTIPMLGFGTWQITGTAAYDAVRTALELGYRHIDTARMYGNEDQVGSAVADSGLDRGQVFITTKLPPNEAADPQGSLDASLAGLGTDYVDLWLIHWPPPGSSPDVWAHFVDAQREGKVRAIGVSNYSLDQIDELTAATGVTPAINQIPWSPSDHDAALVDGHRRRGVVLEGYSALKRTNLGDPVLTEIAARHDVSPAQVVMRWHLDTGVVVIPKSVHRDRIAANIDVTQFSLSAEEVEQLNALG